MEIAHRPEYNFVHPGSKFILAVGASHGVSAASTRFAKSEIWALVFLCVAVSAAMSFAQTAEPVAPDPKIEAAKLPPGAFYWNGMNWQALEPLEWSASGIKKSGKSSVWTYRRSQARLQLSEATPLFCYKLPETPSANSATPPLQVLVIARLDQKKDHRELAIASGTGAFAFQAGTTKVRARETTVTGVSPNVFLIAPKEPLLPGEYVIGGSSLAISGYD